MLQSMSFDFTLDETDAGSFGGFAESTFSQKKKLTMEDLMTINVPPQLMIQKASETFDFQR